MVERGDVRVERWRWRKLLTVTCLAAETFFQRFPWSHCPCGAVQVHDVWFNGASERDHPGDNRAPSAVLDPDLQGECPRDNAAWDREGTSVHQVEHWGGGGGGGE